MEVPAEFRTEQFSRRGELTAWGLALLAVAAWLGLQANGLQVSWVYVLVTLFMFAGALASSLSNWVDRRTVLRLEPGGMAFENGLRRVRMTWSQVQRVQVLPIRLGKLVRVYGESGRYFSFHTLGEVEVRGRVGRLGFAEGERILAHILEASGLKKVEGPPDGSGAYYYARE